MTKRTAAARVRRGIAYLNEAVCPGWRRKVTRQRIDMRVGCYVRGSRNPLTHGCGCILAQINAPPATTGRYGSFHRMADHLNLSETDTLRLGFYAEHDAEYDELTEAWKRALA
jgi:hypothetical protein